MTINQINQIATDLKRHEYNFDWTEGVSLVQLTFSRFRWNSTC